jgi:hypothetical protein
MSNRVKDDPGELFDVQTRGLTIDAYHCYSHMQFHAGSATEYFCESRKRPVRHNRRIERVALWHAVLLDEDCKKALEPAHSALLLPPLCDVETRYALQAGIRIVHGTLPFTTAERGTLAQEAKTGNVEFSDGNNISAPDLISRWHDWLWRDDMNRPGASLEALGASAVLAEGCVQLNIVLRQILGWE